PTRGLDNIANKTSDSQADLKRGASGCRSGISCIDTTLTGNASSSSPKLIIPESGDSSSTTSNIGMGFKKRTTDDASFLKPNSAEKIRWSTDEMQPDKGLEMTVALRETDAGQGVPGNFRAQATFNFIYQ
ncbi:fimbrial protein, partial [Escherichia coli]|uniref:fimbrial protein n=1 Tax=Escherichia coli TaxID=562 RepID=UPI00301DB8DC